MAVAKLNPILKADTTRIKKSLILLPNHPEVKKYPDLWLNVYVSESRAHECAGMFVRAKCTRANDLSSADLVVFMGGADVDPQLYGEKKHNKTVLNIPRDNRDVDLYNDCLLRGIPMLGICRGAQFLHVMNGGKLYQDVDGHIGDHSIKDVETGEVIAKASSTHHQMVIPNNAMRVIATANKSTVRHRDPTHREEGDNADVEAFFYEDTMCLGIQGHPEFSTYPFFTRWTLQQIEAFINKSPRVEYMEAEEGKRGLRVKPDFRIVNMKGTK